MNATEIKEQSAKAIELKTGLAGFYGTQAYHRFSPLFPNLVLTDGANYLANKAGAFWLMDIIGSYQKECQKDDMLRDMQFWTLKVTDGEAVVTCERDTNNVAFTQDIPYTDFPLDEIKLYVCNNGDYMVVLLPSEY